MDKYEEKKKAWKKRNKKIISLREKGESLRSIGRIFNLSETRIMQILDKYA